MSTTAYLAIGGTAKIRSLIAQANANFPIPPTTMAHADAAWYSSAGGDGTYPYLLWWRQ
jgi:hypothetical protein